MRDHHNLNNNRGCLSTKKCNFKTERTSLLTFSQSKFEQGF